MNLTFNKTALLFFFILKTMYLLGQDSKSKTIEGKISYLNMPISNINILVKGTTKGTKTDVKGNYRIQARIGDELVYSHVSFKTIHVIVEDVTNILNIELTEKVNTLDETIVIARKEKKAVLERFEKKNKKFKTAMGVVDPKASGFSIGYIDGEEIKPIYSSLSQALNGKLAGVRIDKTGKLVLKPAMSINNVPSPLWDVDGNIYDEEPPIDLTNILDIHIIKTTSRYGTLGAGGVIVVRTKSATFNDVEKKKIAEQYTNKNTYNQDALTINQNDFTITQHTNTLKEINDTKKALAYYNATLKPQIKTYNTHLRVAQNFINIYNDTESAKQIIKVQTLTHNTHPERLKAIAYLLQKLNFKREATEVYERIFKLRASYAQSYRDLANAYKENNQYKKAWRLYMSYLLQGNDVSNEGIGQILYNEMEYLYFNRKNQAAITQKFIPKNENIQDFRNDVRLVVEWNTSEAEFDLEFVNPDQQSYIFEHSLAANQELINQEKEKGYSSKEFIVDAIGKGDWLINLTYKGNKKSEPTYFKITMYYHWGKPNQSQDIKIYELQDQRDKLQLIKLNKAQLNNKL